MATFRFDNNLGRLETRLARLGHDLEEESEYILDQMADLGVELMRAHIETRGTEASGKRGRIETGEMLEDVGRTPVRRNRSRGSVRFGWGLKGEKAEDYFWYQENGFRHWLSGKDVPPMHAFLDAYIRVREEFKGRVQRMMR
jgi:hypothetical protein